MNGSKISTLWVGAAALLCGTGAMLAASGLSAREATVSRVARGDRSADNLAIRLLNVHNAERDRINLPRLKWNRALEREAADWARVLSHRGTLEHADHAMRNGTGENLWMGTAGHWNVETMVGMFIEEKRHYRHADFPNISRTGNWADVGHYSQIVWRDTQEVGCAVVTARGNDVLVCRYWPAGNVWGQRAY